MQKKNNTYTVLLTGGHLTPACAMIDAIRTMHPDWSMVFVGRMHALERDRKVSEEYRIISQKGIPFYPLTMGRFTRALSVSTIISLLKIPIGFVESFFLVRKIHPTIVLAFGGYLAVPITWWAHVFGVPVITHEQTLSPGLANRLISRIADRVLTAFPVIVSGLKNKYSCVGLPVRKEILRPPETCSFPLVSGKPILLISGGSTGAQSMNEKIFPCIKTLTEQFMVIHQTGSASFLHAQEILDTLGVDTRDSYSIHPYIDASDWGFILSHATLCIGRSGANTVYEIVLRSVPSIFIPLPWSAGQEQQKNAQFLVSKHAALLIPQHDLTSGILLRCVSQLVENRKQFSNHLVLLQKTFPTDSANRVVSVLEEVLHSNQV